MSIAFYESIEQAWSAVQQETRSKPRRHWPASLAGAKPQ